MSIGLDFLAELKVESQVSRRYLASVPFEKKDFKPSPKSESLGRLAIHLAEIMAWWTACVIEDKLDFIDFEPEVINSTEDLLSYYDRLVEQAFDALRTVKDEEFSKDWSMTYGDEILFTLSKKQVARTFCMNHLVHHRAQLSVYFRLLDIPVPAVYGPSADDEQVLTIQALTNY